MRTRHFVNIDGPGEKVVAQLVETGLVRDVADLFMVEAEQLEELERFGKQSAQNLVASIAKAKADAMFARLLAALGIPNLGGVLARPIAEKYGKLTALRADVQKRIEAAGGKVTGSVSKKTGYLVAGEDTGKVKLEAAHKHGVPLISEQELEPPLGDTS